MDTRAGSSLTPFSVEVVTRAELESCAAWRLMFAVQRKDHRYYEIVEDTLREGFDYRYFAIRDAAGMIRAVQPFFLIDQDILEGIKPERRRWASFIRRFWPRFLKMRALMVGCAAGEGHLAHADDLSASVVAEVLAHGTMTHAKMLGAGLVLLKEFPAAERGALACFMKTGFCRVPSMPMTVLNIDYDSFDTYALKAMSGNARRHFRKNLRATEGKRLRMTVARDVAGLLDDIYPLYLQVYHRSSLHFEKLTRDYFRLLGERMKDKVVFHLWHRGNRPVAFSLSMVQGDRLVSEYLGFDYAVALELHLYHYVVRDLISWGIEHGYKSFGSSGLNYDPKLHFGHRLDPIDLYARHVSPLVNAVFRATLPWLLPVRYDQTLKKFPNYRDLW